MKKLSAVLLALVMMTVLAACDNKQAKDENKEGTNTEQGAEEKKDEQKEENKGGETEDKAETKAKEGIMVGDLAMDFELEAFNVEGKHKISDYRGKNPVIIKFFASWCGPCHMEFPALKEVYEENGDKGLVVLAVNLGVNDIEADVVQMIDDYLIKFPVLKDPSAEVSYNYNIRSIPVNIFIDKDGIIKEKTVGMQTKEQYEKNLKLIMPE